MQNFEGGAYTSPKWVIKVATSGVMICKFSGYGSRNIGEVCPTRDGSGTFQSNDTRLLYVNKYCNPPVLRILRDHKNLTLHTEIFDLEKKTIVFLSLNYFL